ncbi:MAG: MMPL family transporter [Spirochaetes bacterium]|nr:MMPL family transporter [Spirochaetota bacterium]
MIRKHIRLPYIILIVIAAAAMSYLGKSRLAVDMDITKSLPVNDRVIADAEYVMTHHPVKDRIVIDLGCARADTDSLVAGAALIEGRFAESGLFRSVGLDEYQTIFPELISYIMDNLPVLFTAEELDRKVRPLLAPDRVKETFADNYSQLLNLEGIGQGNMMASDPLGLKNLVLARMAHLAPSRNVQIVQGRLLSADGRHVLITAEPRGSATDTAVARKIDSLIRACAADLDKKYKPRGIALTVTPVGAFRAALDNEDTARRDTEKAVLFATIGIIILLLVGFPRPFMGVLALVPAVLGTIAAAFVFSLFSREISILAIGFGGTIISFTVDYGIAYLLFLDRPHETRGMEATREVWGLGLLSMLTTAISFAFLFISGFSALAQIGFFTSLGVVFTYIFVHTLFPVVFPVMPPARRKGLVPLQRFVDLLMGSGPLFKVYGAAAFCAFMLLFARPDFKVDLASMNTVSRSTLKAEALVTKTWGNVLSNLYLMTEGRSVDDLQRLGDRAAGELDKDMASGVLSAAFVPSMIFPGKDRMKENLAAWRAFWTPARVASLKRAVKDASRETGFAPDAFDTFFKTVGRRDFEPRPIPEKYLSVLGIHPMKESTGWAQFSVLKPGPSYRADRFYERVSAGGNTRLFDPSYFADRLGGIILSSFIKMALIVGAITAAVALLYLLDLKLTAISLAPTLFSLICTLGTMKLLGQQPGIPTIIVTVIVIGMGTDYALYLVRAHQRYMDEAHPSVGLIRLTVALSAASTMIGFGVLSVAEHALLRNAGITLLLGIGYSFAGTVLIVPPLLKRVLVPGELPATPFEAASKEHAARVQYRYRGMEPYPRLFARFKMRFDPMFGELHRMAGSPETIVDIGTGYGVPAIWLLELFPGSRLYGIEPDVKRARAASWAIGGRGSVTVGKAPDIPDFPGKADTVTAIDMIHYLDDHDLGLLLDRLRVRMLPKGTLIIRGTVPSRKRAPLRMIEMAWIRVRGLPMHYRSEEDIVRIMKGHGFAVTVGESSLKSREEKWFLGTMKKGRKR